MTGRWWRGSRRRQGVAVGFCALLALAVTPLTPPRNAVAQERAPARSPGYIQLSLAPIVAKSAPAAVDIRTIGATPGRSVYFPGRPPGGARNVVSAASGVIVRADGWIVTATHVVLGAEAVTVELNDTRRFGAEVVLIDHRAGLAILHIDTGGAPLPYIAPGDSDALQVGDLLLALGNPFGIGQTATMVIVSALGRTIPEVSNFQSFIQTDAAINPGSSGGPLVAIDGTLAGINTVIFSRTGDSVGIGLAIPSNMVSQVLAAAIGVQVTIRPWVGSSLAAPGGQEAPADGAPRKRGAVVEALYPGGPAERAGLREGDRITALNGRTVPDPIDFTFRIATMKLGEASALTVDRDGGEIALTFPLEPLPETPPRDLTRAPDKLLNGILMGNLSPALADVLGLDPMDAGVVMLEFQGLGTNGSTRLQIGDVLLKINDWEIEQVSDVADSVTEVRRDWKVTIRRGGTEFILDVFL